MTDVSILPTDCIVTLAQHYVPVTHSRVFYTASVTRCYEHRVEQCRLGLRWCTECRCV